MKHFIHKVIFYIPCPREFQIRNEAASIAIAVKRAIQEARKNCKGKRIKQIQINSQEI